MASRTTKKPTKNVAEWKYKKDKKAIHMWIEQLLIRLNKVEETIGEVKETVNYISDFLDIKDKVKENA